LRQHHWNANIVVPTANGDVSTQVCATCHLDANPTAFIPVGENTPPPYYFTPDPNHPNKPSDPCSPNGEEDFAGTPLGLNNDGDLDYDAADLDCQPAADADIVVAPLALDFGTITVGTTLTLTTTISNVGGADLTVTSFTPTGSVDFSLNPATQLPPFTIAPGGSVDVSVDYTPGEAAADVGTLIIASNDPDEPTVTVSLAGTGEAPTGGQCDIAVAPLALDFMQVVQGNIATLTTTITNNSADTDCIVSALTFTGSADFALNTGAPATPFAVPPLGSVAVPVDYTPVDVGADSGTLDIASDDPVNPVVSVSLAGEGIAAVCDIDVNPLALDFGPVNLGPGHAVYGRTRRHGRRPGGLHAVGCESGQRHVGHRQRRSG
jgi:hypothetical protein